MNCVVLLMLSSALPLLSRTLGMWSKDHLFTYTSVLWEDNSLKHGICISMVWSSTVLYPFLLFSVTIILGITKFNLLGHFSSLEWQHSFWLLFAYNVLFLAITSVILCRRVTRSIVREASLLLGSRLVCRTSTKKREWLGFISYLICLLQILLYCGTVLLCVFNIYSLCG